MARSMACWRIFHGRAGEVWLARGGVKYLVMKQYLGVWRRCISARCARRNLAEMAAPVSAMAASMSHRNNIISALPLPASYVLAIIGRGNMAQARIWQCGMTYIGVS